MVQGIITAPEAGCPSLLAPKDQQTGAPWSRQNSIARQSLTEASVPDSQPSPDLLGKKLSEVLPCHRLSFGCLVPSGRYR